MVNAMWHKICTTPKAGWFSNAVDKNEACSARSVFSMLNSHVWWPAAALLCKQEQLSAWVYSYCCHTTSIPAGQEALLHAGKVQEEHGTACCYCQSLIIKHVQICALAG
jgi:hypothetical protein